MRLFKRTARPYRPTASPIEPAIAGSERIWFAGQAEAPRSPNHPLGVDARHRVGPTPIPAYGSRPWESPSWLAYPTLTHGKGTQIKCAGAYYHQHEIRAAVQMHGSFVMAELRIETEGDYPGAVRVFVGGVQLASIPHDYTLAYQSVVEELGRASRPATLHVRLEADDYVDVWGFCEPKVRPPDEPLLCPQETEFVNLHDGVAEQLDTSLKSRARTKVVQRIGLLERSGDDPWRVILEGQEIGVLRRAPFMRLREAEAAGLSLATVVDIRRKPERPLAVSVGFPRDD